LAVTTTVAYICGARWVSAKSDERSRFF
jgi:hypothetical protein